jgi:hypothetical protein
VKEELNKDMKSLKKKKKKKSLPRIKTEAQKQKFPKKSS